MIDAEVIYPTIDRSVHTVLVVDDNPATRYATGRVIRAAAVVVAAALVAGRVGVRLVGRQAQRLQQRDPVGHAHRLRGALVPEVHGLAGRGDVEVVPGRAVEPVPHGHGALPGRLVPGSPHVAVVRREHLRRDDDYPERVLRR